MCGRFTLFVPKPQLLEHYGIPSSDVRLSPRYNIAPSQDSPVVVLEDDHPSLLEASWGFPTGPRVSINARAESLRSSPAFRGARRCLVPASGFYEWSSGKPYYFPAPGGVWSLAGVCSQGSPSFAIITVPANEAVSSLHDRMPAVLSEDEGWSWLRSGDGSSLRPFPGPMRRFAVSSRVNDVKNEGAGLIRPLPTLGDFS